MAEVRGLIHGLGKVPTTYFRRAVRPDEVFLVAKKESVRRMLAR
jgi:hypothetical protein